MLEAERLRTSLPPAIHPSSHIMAHLVCKTCTNVRHQLGKPLHSKQGVGVWTMCADRTVLSLQWLSVWGNCHVCRRLPAMVGSPYACV